MNDSINEENVTIPSNQNGEPEENELDVIEPDEENETSEESLMKFFSMIQNSMSDNDDDDDDIGTSMDANDYHNKAVDYARKGRNDKAVQICKEGLSHFPLNVDLIADTIKYSCEMGDMACAEIHYKILKEKIPYERWNWRAFTFSFDYLLEVDPVGNEAICRELIEQYKLHIPYEEKSYMAESELESALGNYEESMNALKKAITEHANASQCALHLADMQLEWGLFEDAVDTANYGISASAEVQPSINIPYLYLVRTLARDSILHKRYFSGDKVTEHDVEKISEEYELLEREFPELLRHTETVEMRKKMLKFINVEA